MMVVDCGATVVVGRDGDGVMLLVMVVGGDGTVVVSLMVLW